MKYTLILSLLLSILFVACVNKDVSKNITEKAPNFDNKAHEITYKMVQKVGTYNDLLNHKDVIYTYTYELPSGKTDVTEEKYIFDGELSYGSYLKHERTLPDLEGTIEQGYDGDEYWFKHNGEASNDPEILKKVAFNRPTNFYWFAMFQKLLDPGVQYEYVGEKLIDDNQYDIVKITFDYDNNKPTDIYQLYINRSTSLVDQFLFTVADFGKMEVPLLMKLEYVKVDDMMIPAQRIYKASTWDADVSDEPWVKVTWSDIKYNNNLTKDDFTK